MYYRCCGWENFTASNDRANGSPANISGADVAYGHNFRVLTPSYTISGYYNTNYNARMAFCGDFPDAVTEESQLIQRGNFTIL